MRLRVATLTLLLLSAGLAGAGMLLVHEPDFYRRAAAPPGPDRQERSSEFFAKNFVPFLSAFTAGKGPWNFEFTQTSINAFFEEDFVRFGDADQFRKIGVTDPRVELEKDRIRLGFRYGWDKWSAVFSYDVKAWLAKGDVNTLVVEFQRRRIGALQIPSQRLFRDLTELGRKHNIDVTWYRLERNPVAVIRFQSDRLRAIAQNRSLAELRAFRVEPGKLLISGMSFDPNLALDEAARAASAKSDAPKTP